MSEKEGVPEEVPEVLTVEQVVEQQIATIGVKAELEQFAAEAKKTKVLSVEDKEGYIAAKAKLKEAVRLRNAIEAKRKGVKDPFFQAGKKVDAAAAELQVILVPAETHLIAECKKVEDHEALLAKQKEEAKQAKITERRNQVIAFAPTTTADGYAVGGVQITQRELEVFTDSDFKARIGLMTIEYNRLKAEKEADAKKLEEFNAWQAQQAADAKRAALEASQKDLANAGNPAISPADPFAEAGPGATVSSIPASEVDPNIPVAHVNVSTVTVLPEPFKSQVAEIIALLDKGGYTCPKGKLSDSKSYKRLRAMAGIA